MRLLLILALAGCRSGALLGPADALAIGIAGADPVAASELVRQRAGRGCDGWQIAIAALDRAPLEPAIRSALIDDAIAAARPRCQDLSLRGDGIAAQLARSLLEPDTRAALAHLDGEAPVIRFRRAELLSALGQRDRAIDELAAGLERAPDPARRARLVRELIAADRAAEALSAAARLPGDHPARIEALAAAGRAAEVGVAIASAPIETRIELARRAVAASDDPEALIADGAPAPLARAVADHLAGARDMEAAAALYARAAAAAPNDADVHAALAAALAASGRLDQALAAWDRARALNPATPSAAIDPIAALAAAGRRAEARARASAIAAGARTAAELEIASAAAAASGDAALALTLAQRALGARPGDGALAFLVARRLAQANRTDAALAALAALLRCGSRGRPWHRHEVAAEIVRVARAARAIDDAIAALDRLTCAPPQSEAFTSFDAELRRELDR